MPMVQQGDSDSSFNVAQRVSGAVMALQQERTLRREDAAEAARRAITMLEAVAEGTDETQQTGRIDPDAEELASLTMIVYTNLVLARQLQKQQKTEDPKPQPTNKAKDEPTRIDLDGRYRG